MDATEGMKKAIANRKASQVNTLNRLDKAVKESQATRQRQTVEQRRQE